MGKLTAVVKLLTRRCLVLILLPLLLFVELLPSLKAAAQEAYVCRPDEFKPIPPLTTPINRVIGTGVGWTTTLTTVEVNDDGQFKFNVQYRKGPGATGRIYCPNPMRRDDIYLKLKDGTRIDPIDQFCSYHRGEIFDNDLNIWAIFPGLSKYAMPLTLASWFGWGTLSDITINIPDVPATTIIDYIALGDSIPASSGGWTDQSLPYTCDKLHSSQSYPWQVAHALSMRHETVYFLNLACWAATLLNSLDGQQSSFEGQVTLTENILTENIRKNSTRPTLISITYGVNELSPNSSLLPISAGLDGLIQLIVSMTDDQFTTWANSITSTVRNSIISEGGRLLRFPNVSLIITDYPNPINTSADFFGFPARSRSEMALLALSDRLKEAASELAKQYPGTPPRVSFVSVYDAFEGHELPRPNGTCPSLRTTDPPDTPCSWFQHGGSQEFPGPADPNSNVNDCRHPNLLGAATYATNPTTSLSCADQICTRRIAAFRSQATKESGVLRTRKPL